MLPIDEHAKSGVVVLLLCKAERHLCWARMGYWDGEDFRPITDLSVTISPTHYLPAPLVEHAAKMREALHGLFVGCRGADTAALRILAATEWPPERETLK